MELFITIVIGILIIITCSAICIVAYGVEKQRCEERYHTNKKGRKRK